MVATHLPHLTYKMAIAMASAKLELLHITYVDSIRAILEIKESGSFKNYLFSYRRASCIRSSWKADFSLGDLAVTSSGQNNIEVNHKNAQKGIAVAHVAHRAWDFFRRSHDDWR